MLAFSQSSASSVEPCPPGPTAIRRDSRHSAASTALGPRRHPRPLWAGFQAPAFVWGFSPAAIWRDGPRRHGMPRDSAAEPRRFIAGFSAPRVGWDSWPWKVHAKQRRPMHAADLARLAGSARPHRHGGRRGRRIGDPLRVGVAGGEVEHRGGRLAAAGAAGGGGVLEHLVASGIDDPHVGRIRRVERDAGGAGVRCR